MADVVSLLISYSFYVANITNYRHYFKLVPIICGCYMCFWFDLSVILVYYTFIKQISRLFARLLLANYRHYPGLVPIICGLYLAMIGLNDNLSF